MRLSLCYAESLLRRQESRYGRLDPTTSWKPIRMKPADSYSRLFPPGRYNLQISPRGFWPEQVKDLLIPRENGVHVEATVLRRGRIVACQ